MSFLASVRPVCVQARKALADRQKDLEMKTQQLEIKLSNKHEEDIKKARRKSTQAGQGSDGSKVTLRVIRGGGGVAVTQAEWFIIL